MASPMLSTAMAPLQGHAGVLRAEELVVAAAPAECHLRRLHVRGFLQDVRGEHQRRVAQGADGGQTQGGDQRVRAHRAQLPAVLARARRQLAAGGDRHQRHRRREAGVPPPQVRLHAGHLRRGRQARGRQRHLRGRQGDQGGVRPQPLQPAVGRDGHRPRHRGHRRLRRPRRRGQASRGRRQEGAHHRARQGRHPHLRLRRQRRPLHPRRHHHQQRLLHHQLPRPLRQGARPKVRHHQGNHDHNPLLHRRPEAAGREPPRPAPCPCRRAQHRAHLHRRGQGRGAGAAQPQGQAQRDRAPGAHPQRVRRRPRGAGLQEDPRRGGEPGVPRRRRQRAQGHPRRLRRAARVRRLQVLRRVLHHRRVAQHGHGRRHGQGHRVVRQRVGLLPEGRRPRRHRRRPMEVNAGRRHYCPVK
ncbi:unnamed protein product [Triticum turgidum subsp. durum]|uniref:Uncharacterized protein n=1 Tax=Triticum turgidum subsp. durum TaxID=4567 RepID=A0A9R1NY50_TRITD|nr:unnamed protein product [Triticum turgidum subsp. durum]